MAEFSQHWITGISAHRHDYPNSPLMLKLKVKYSDLPSEITLYLDNDELTGALVKAINAAVKEHTLGKMMEDHEVEAVAE